MDSVVLGPVVTEPDQELTVEDLRRTEAKGGPLSRIFSWYRRAVSSPATEQERERWQQDGF